MQKGAGAVGGGAMGAGAIGGSGAAGGGAYGGAARTVTLGVAMPVALGQRLGGLRRFAFPGKTTP